MPPSISPAGWQCGGRGGRGSGKGGSGGAEGGADGAAGRPARVHHCGKVRQRQGARQTPAIALALRGVCIAKVMHPHVFRSDCWSACSSADCRLRTAGYKRLWERPFLRNTLIWSSRRDASKAAGCEAKTAAAFAVEAERQVQAAVRERAVAANLATTAANIALQVQASVATVNSGVQLLLRWKR